MPSKSKEARLDQKVYLENRLKNRITVLSEKGVEPAKITKDITVRKIRAEIRETSARLKVIAGKEKKIEEMAKIRAAKAAAAKKKDGKKKKGPEESPEMSKRQKKKKEKKQVKAKG